MKKLLIGLGVALVLLLAVVIVGPGFVDWNAYKAEIAQAARDATGRQLQIEGDISATLLPSPRLTARDVRFENVEGATAPDFARIESIDVSVALGPLIGGTVQVDSIILMKPEIRFEVLADGRNSLSFAPEEAVQGGQSTGEAASGGAPAGGGASDGDSVPQPAGSSAQAAADDGGLPISLDRVVIQDGSFTFTNQGTGAVHRAEAVAAEIAAGSLTNGPFKLDGSLVYQDIPLGLQLSIGEIIHGRTVPIGVTLAADGGAGEVTLSGTLAGLGDEPRFRGKIEADAANLAQLAQSLSGAPLPGMLAQAFELKADIAADQKTATVENGQLALGTTRATLALNANYENDPAIGAAINVGTINLNKWLELAEMIPALGPVGPNRAIELAQAAGTVASDGGAGAGFVIPANISAALEFNVDAIIYRNSSVRQTRAVVDVAQGEVTLSQFAAQLPGSADVAVFGFLTAANGQPRFEGNLEAAVGDLRSTLNWLGVSLEQVPADRLRGLTLTTEIAATPAQADLTNFLMTFDASRLQGAMTVALRERLGLGLSLALDRLNLDAYLPETGKAPAPKEPAPSSGQQAGATAGQADAQAGAGGGSDQAAEPAEVNPFEALRVLTGFDANIRAAVGQLTYKGQPIEQVDADLTLFDGDLTIRNFSVAKAAGAKLLVSGALEGLDALPSAKALQVRFQAPRIDPVLALAGQSPLGLKLGAVNVDATVNGSLLKPTLALKAGAAGGTLSLTGATALLPPGAAGTLQVNHPNVEKLLSALGVAYDPAGPVGALALKSDFEAGLSSITAKNLALNVGKLALGGTVETLLGGDRPKIDAQLTGGDLVLDPLLPAQRNAALPFNPEAYFGIPGLVPASMVVPAAPAKRPGLIKVAGPWPEDPLDLSGMRAVDADVTLKARSISYQAYQLSNADLAATLDDGLLTVSKLTGKAYDGSLAAAANLDGRGRPAFGLNLKLDGVDIAKALQAVTGKAAATGLAGMNWSLTGQGASAREIVGALNGNGDVRMAKVDVREATRGTIMASLLNLMAGLNSSVGGKGTTADLSAGFNVTNGIAKTDDLTLTSGMGNGLAAGTINLPDWTLDVAGKVTMDNNFLGTVLKLANRAQLTEVPFALSGPIDKPNVKLDTKSLGGGGLPIPGLDKVLGNSKAGRAIQQILGGGSGSGSSSGTSTSGGGSSSGDSGSDGGMAPPPSRQSDQQQPKQIDPAELLRGIFR
ncbi:MAG: AsmA family protein [Magnetovibrionaceae bacterium]